MVQLDCIEDGCKYKTQDLPFDEANKILDKHLDRNHPVGGKAQPEPVDVQLACPNAGCSFKTQEGLPKDHAQRVLENSHMPRCKFKPSATQAAAPAPATSSSSMASSEAGSYYIKLSGMVWSATKDDIINFLSDCSIKDVALIKTETGRPSGNISSFSDSFLIFVFPGVAAVEVESKEDIARAIRHDRQYLKERFVIVEEISASTYKTILSFS